MAKFQFFHLCCCLITAKSQIYFREENYKNSISVIFLTQFHTFKLASNAKIHSSHKHSCIRRLIQSTARQQLGHTNGNAKKNSNQKVTIETLNWTDARTKDDKIDQIYMRNKWLTGVCTTWKHASILFMDIIKVLPCIVPQENLSIIWFPGPGYTFLALPFCTLLPLLLNHFVFCSA